MSVSSVDSERWKQCKQCKQFKKWKQCKQCIQCYKQFMCSASSISNGILFQNDINLRRCWGGPPDIGRKPVTLFFFSQAPIWTLRRLVSSFFVFSSVLQPLKIFSTIFYLVQQRMADLTLRLSCGKSFDRRKPELGKNEGMLICDGGGKKLNNDCSEA